MKYFCDVSSILQITLLVLSHLTVVTVIGFAVLVFRNRYKMKQCFGILFVLIINVALNVLMQMDNRLTGSKHLLHLPYILILVITLGSLGFTVLAFLQETRKRETINNASIKEAFDNLPTGVCFFNESGLPVLCNREMHRFSFAVNGKDVQFISDLQELLSEEFIPINGTAKAGKVFTLSDGRTLQLEQYMLDDDNRGAYTEFVTLDVTDLQKKRMELTEENKQLRRTQTELKKLSANVVAVTREEEILNTKMRIHDEMGKCLVEARKYLRDGNDNIPQSVVYSWQRAVSMLKYNNETNDDDMLSQVRQTCESMGINFKQIGSLPEEETAAYILTCTIRECVTNAVRYAGASELYAEFTENEVTAGIVVTNNGKQPENEIVEGGGLSTLRRRVERAGGTMTVKSLPSFELTVTIPKRKGGIL